MGDLLEDLLFVAAHPAWAANTDAGAAELADDPNITTVETAFRPAVAAVATGYATDVTSSTARARIDDSMNAGSQRRIAVTSSVKARN